MGSMMRIGMLIVIIGSVSCVLIGGVIAAVRITKLIRRERFLANQNLMNWQIGNTAQEDAESKSGDT